MARMGIALQLYTIRNETDKDFVSSLRKVAAAGYEGVEFAGFGGLSAEDLKQLLEELNLKPVGSHVGLDRVTNHLHEEIAFHTALGSQSVVVPWIDERYRSAEGIKAVLEVLETAGKAFAAAGIPFGYHNHDFELTVTVEDQPLLDHMFSHLSPDTVFAELDTAWIHHAGKDAAGYVLKYGKRVPLIHLKDLRVEDRNVLTVPLGDGNVPLQAIISASESAGVQWMIVEQDHLQEDAFDSIRTSREWLRKHYA